MKNPIGLRTLTSTLAGVLSISMVACSKPADTTDMPAPSTTVGTQLDDSLITTKVKTALLDNDGIKGMDIQVETRKGEVMLSGFVDNQAQVDGAVVVTRGIEGVKSVDNKLTLKNSVASMGNKLDDSVVTTKVKTALLADTSIKGLDITVNTSKGEVQLSGFVDNQGQMDRAVEVAHGIEGVTMVGNQLTIKK
jgi:hyperosmotically inducible protein